MSELRCTRLADNIGRKNYAKNRHLHHLTICRAIYSQLRHLSTIGESLLKSIIFSTCPHNMVNFGPLTAEIGLEVWGSLADFNGFRALGSLLHQRRSTDINQTLHDVWRHIGLLHYTIGLYTFPETVASSRNFSQVQNSLCVQVLRSPILAALLHGI